MSESADIRNGVPNLFAAFCANSLIGERGIECIERRVRKSSRAVISAATNLKVHPIAPEYESALAQF